ncbi:MAG: type III secretion system chaperone family protein [Bacillota bacterium]
MHYQVYKEESLLAFCCDSLTGSWIIESYIDEEGKILAFHLISDVHVPETKMQEAAEFITRANTSILIGNFELDMETGQIRFKTSVRTEGMPLTHVVINNLINTNGIAFDMYFPGLMAVIYGGTPPAKAIDNLIKESPSTLPWPTTSLAN